MKTINLFFDFEFTSLSPDAQIISIGIVSDCSKSFYAEFSDFEINRCDDWVKENVLSKLTISSFKNVMPNGAENNEYEVMDFADNSISYYGDTHKIKESLKEWLSQFYDYQIQFVSDCGTFDWYWMLQLLAEWEQKENVFEYDETVKPSEIEIPKRFDMFHGRYVKTGLPKLPENISPVPEDLNDRIAFKKGISVKEAFDLNREVLAFGIHSNSAFKKMLDEEQFSPYKEKINKHNSLWDAKVIKNVYNKLK